MFGSEVTGMKKRGDRIKSLLGKLGVVLVALSFLILTGCANTFGDLVRSKEEGKGKSRVYKVNLVRKSSTFHREGSHGALNPVLAPCRDKPLTGLAEKGIVFMPAAEQRGIISNGVNVDRAWEIAKTVFQWERIEDIKQNRSEGYMVIKSGATWFYKVNLMVVWIEPIDKVQSRITVIAKSKTSVDTILGLSEIDFHEMFALFAQGPEIR